MNRWERERADHVYENTVGRPGPIIRSRVVRSEAVDAEPTPQPGGADLVTCPTCGQEFPGVAAACPVDGTAFASPR